MRERRGFPVFLFLAFLAAGCSQPAEQEIPIVKEPGSTLQPAPPRMETAQRMGIGGGMGQQQQGDPLGGLTFHVDVPDGWEQLAATDFRQVNLRMTDKPEVECYFTLLPGGGGGLDANINRWRRQMGLEALGPDEIAALPKKTLFGIPATFVDVEGTFSGMGGGAAPQEGYRMYGLMLYHEDPESGQAQGLFLKMTGPADVLAGQEENFDNVASSLHVVGPGDDHTHGDMASAPVDNPHAGASAMASSAAPESAFNWTLPEGWVDLPPRMMREANVTIDGQPDVECYLTKLSGRHGGMDLNINRWRQQMGQPDLSADEIAALPKKPMLGGEAAYVTIDGTFGGMSGAVSQDNYRMYGLVLVKGDDAYFVKMTGPKDVLAGQEANFLAFSASISEGGAAPAAHATAEAPAAPANPHGNMTPMPAPETSALKWTAPEGWLDGGSRMMREVTYEIGDVECYIAVLPGDAGGINANINRWVGQMGQAPLDDAALAALPRIALLGQEAPMVEVGGDFKNMQGDQKEGYKLLGTLVSTDKDVIFVKMTGPGAEVEAQKDKFIAFCKSVSASGG